MILGFCLLGVGLVIIIFLLGILINGGYKIEMLEKFSLWFFLIFLVIFYLIIGLFFVIFRIVMVFFEIGVVLIVGYGLIVFLCFIVCFFVVVYYFVIRLNGILDSVGKILIFVFVFLIFFLVVVGVIVYGNLESVKVSVDYVGKVFGSGVLVGYNIFDVFVVVVFCLVVIEMFKKFGFKIKKEYLLIIWIVGIVISLVFSILYIGLGFLGNKFFVLVDILVDLNVNKGVYVLL